jgi:hypothetical protein
MMLSPLWKISPLAHHMKTAPFAEEILLKENAEVRMGGAKDSADGFLFELISLEICSSYPAR